LESTSEEVKRIDKKEEHSRKALKKRGGQQQFHLPLASRHDNEDRNPTFHEEPHKGIVYLHHYKLQIVLFHQKGAGSKCQIYIVAADLRWIFIVLNLEVNKSLAHVIEPVQTFG
jgi:hypothetical protein